jgi:translation initiation factor IF-3
LSRPFPSRSSSSSGPFFRVNGKIRAREVRVIALDGKQLGILSLGDALNLARHSGVDLVEVAPNAVPPVCRVVDFGKFRYEQAKREKESKKHQHATKVKEVQLSPKIDPHDLGVKVNHAIDFLCEDMKVKISLRFRGREMAHTEIGFQVIQKFLEEVAPYGQKDFDPKLIGRGITLMVSPLPRNKRAKNPHQTEFIEAPSITEDNHQPEPELAEAPTRPQAPLPANSPSYKPSPPKPKSGGFVNNPFAQIELNR